MPNIELSHEGTMLQLSNHVTVTFYILHNLGQLEMINKVMKMTSISLMTTTLERSRDKHLHEQRNEYKTSFEAFI